MKVYPHMTITS